VAAALAHLAAALAQCLPSDNEVIVGHLHEAYLALGGDPYRYRAV
jgi:hypothetical protein